ncbi:EF-hand domain protein [soil metagenome]
MTRLHLASIGLVTALLCACAGSPHPDDRSAPGMNGDGRPGGGGRLVFISPAGEPFRAAHDAPYPVAAWFAGADTDHDGKLTRAEFLADADRFFRVLDENHDGVIDGFEVQAYEQKIAPEILPEIGRLRAGEGQDDSLFKAGGARRDRRNAGREPQGGKSQRVQAADHGGQGAGLYGFFTEPQPVAAADADFDGKITPKEWRAKAERAFDRLDVTKAGSLTLATLPKTPQQEAVEARRAREAKRASKN